MGEVGAYGLRLSDLPPRLFVEPADGWADWRLEFRAGDGGGAADFLDDGRASVALTPEGRLTLDRGAALATIETPERPSDEAVAHPYLAAVAAVTARWLGQNGLHAGGFATDAGCWAVLGGTSSGKSSLLAALARRGIGVVADDLLVTRGATALAGPRCLDLRADVARLLATGRPLGVLGGRERWRVHLPPIDPELPLAGTVVLGWGETTRIARVTVGERLPRLLRAVALALTPVDPDGLMTLAGMPTHLFERPRRADELDAGIDRLLDAVDG